MFCISTELNCVYLCVFISERTKKTSPDLTCMNQIRQLSEIYSNFALIFVFIAGCISDAQELQRIIAFREKNNDASSSLEVFLFISFSNIVLICPRISNHSKWANFTSQAKNKRKNNFQEKRNNNALKYLILRDLIIFMFRLYYFFFFICVSFEFWNKIVRTEKEKQKEKIDVIIGSR